LAGIAGIDDVLARLDSVSAAVRALLAAIGFPAVLEDMIAAYCINC
jgi:aspartate aminotransferase-like enzyme